MQPARIADGPSKGEDYSDSARNMHGEGGRSIRDEGREFEGWAKGGDKGKGPRNKTVGKTGECDKAGIPKRVHPGGTGMDEDCDNS